MVMKIYSVFDKKTVLYGRPFYAHNRGHAMRCISDELSNKDSMLAKHPSDYSLYEIGEYDDFTGVIVSQEPSCVVELSDLLRIDKE